MRQHVMVVETIADRGSYVAADRGLGLIRAIYQALPDVAGHDLRCAAGQRKPTSCTSMYQILPPIGSLCRPAVRRPNLAAGMGGIPRSLDHSSQAAVIMAAETRFPNAGRTHSQKNRVRPPFIGHWDGLTSRRLEEKKRGPAVRPAPEGALVAVVVVFILLGRHC